MDGYIDEREVVPAQRDGVVERMLSALPSAPADGRDVVTEAIVSCQDCAQAATACADARLGEEMVEELSGCVRALLDAADIAAVTARVLSRTVTDPAVVRAQLTACWTASRHAREQCQEHRSTQHHCESCARACRHAELACRALLDRP